MEETVTALLRIVDFQKNFLVNRNKELKGMPWIAVPTRLDGDGYTALMEHPNGVAHYGAWISIVIIAAKCSVRGLLSRESRTDAAPIPHVPATLSRISRVPQNIYEEAIPRLIEIGWLERVAEIPQDGAGLVRDECDNPAGASQVAYAHACAPARRDDVTDVRDVTVRNETKRHDTGASENSLFEEFWDAYPANADRRKPAKLETCAEFVLLPPHQQVEIIQAAKHYAASGMVARKMVYAPIKFIRLHWHDWVDPPESGDESESENQVATLEELAAMNNPRGAR